MRFLPLLALLVACVDAPAPTELECPPPAREVTCPGPSVVLDYGGSPPTVTCAWAPGESVSCALGPCAGGDYHTDGVTVVCEAADGGPPRND